MNSTKNLTEGKVSHVFFGFFFPMLFTNLLQQLYVFVDTAIVGKGLGDNALAAVGNISAFTLLIIGFAQGLAGGFSVIIALRFGSGDISALRKSAAEAVKLAVILSAGLTVLSFIFLKKTMLIMRTDAVILNESLTYGYIIFGGLAVTMAYNLCSGILRALGDSKTPFTAIMISSVINILLDCLFIFVIKTSVGGAAVATVAAQAVSAGICIGRLRKTECINLSRADFGREFSLSCELLRNGLPMACMNSITAVGCMIIQSYVNALGVEYTSAYSICNKYISLFMLPAVTAGFALSAFTSQNYGAGRHDRIRAGVLVGLIIGVVSYVILGGAMIVFPESLAGLMLSGRESIEAAAEFMRICGAGFILLNFLFVYRSAVQGLGKPLAPMCSGLIETALRIAVIVLFMKIIGFRAAGYAEICAWAGALAVNWAAWHRLAVDGQ